MNLSKKSEDLSINGIGAPRARARGPLNAVYSPTRLAVTSLFLIFSLINMNAGYSLSLFNDTDTSTGNLFRAGIWGPPQGPPGPPNPSDIVLNEFLPNPDATANGLNFGDDNDNKPLGEWIELYNKGNVPQDVLGWFVTDASGGGGNTHAVIGPSNTNTGSTIIPAHGWLVVYMNKPTLNNTGDDIFLYMSSTTQIDTVSYDDPSDACKLPPTPGNENSTTTPTGVPGNGQNADCIANQVAPNKSYARIPDGTGGWVDPIPTPGGPNELVEPSAPAPVSISEPAAPAALEISEPVTVIDEGAPADPPVVEISEPVTTIEPPEAPPTDAPPPAETPPAESTPPPAETPPTDIPTPESPQ